jgi:hypothetical protein
VGASFVISFSGKLPRRLSNPTENRVSCRLRHGSINQFHEQERRAGTGQTLKRQLASVDHLASNSYSDRPFFRRLWRISHDRPQTMTEPKQHAPAPSEDDVLRRMLSTPPKPHVAKPHPKSRKQPKKPK